MVQSGADGGGDRLLDQEDPAGSRRQRRLLNRAPLDGRRVRWHADHDLGAGESLAIVDLADEVLDHVFSRSEIGDDTIAHRLNCLDMLGRSAKHGLGLCPDRLHLPAIRFMGDRHD